MSEDNDEIYRNRVLQAFEGTLNRHGYGFQYAVLNEIKQLSDPFASKWLAEATEFPVIIQEVGTRIDFILKRTDWPPFYLLAECKRANPALSNWCFARSPFVHRSRVNFEPYFLEHLERDSSSKFQSCARPVYIAHNAYHIALEVKTDEKGEQGGTGRGAIEEAATQICRGLNGTIEFLSRNPQMFNEQYGAYFLPVIFTTAQLWTTEVDLASANIESGKLDLTQAGFQKRPWLLYQYHLSPGLKHSLSPVNRSGALGDILDSEYIRSIPIVNPSGIKDFLYSSSGLSLR